MTILVIDTDKLLAQAIQAKMTQKGVGKVIIRRSGQLGLDAVDDHKPDCIILETQLGLHNGVEFLYELRSYGEWSELPVIVYSSNSHILDPAFSPMWKQLQVAGLLYKPQTSLDQLVKAVGNVIQVSV